MGVIGQLGQVNNLRSCLKFQLHNLWIHLFPPAPTQITFPEFKNHFPRPFAPTQKKRKHNGTLKIVRESPHNRKGLFDG